MLLEADRGRCRGGQLVHIHPSRATAELIRISLACHVAASVRRDGRGSDTIATVYAISESQLEFIV